MKKYITGLFISVLLYTQCLSLTLLQIRNDLRVKIGDAKADINNRHWSDSILNTRINIVQDEIAKETLCIQARISTTTVANQREYNYNSDVIVPFRMSYMINSTSYTVYMATSAAYKKLEFKTIAGLDNDSSNWENATPGLPMKYYERGQTYGLYPAPSTVYASTWAVQIDYYKKPTALSSDNDIPFDGDVLLYSYHKLLIYGVVIMCREDDRLDVSSIKTEYWALIQKMKEDVKTRQDRSGGFGVR